TPNTLSFVPYLAYTFAAGSWKYEVHDLATSSVSFVVPVGEPLDLHELQLLANGDYLLLSDPIITGVDLTGLSTFGPDEAVIGCDVQELTPAGAVVWQWSAMAHFDPVKDSTWPQTTGVAGAEVIDPFHCNSIDVASNGDLLLSARAMDSVFLVSRATGNVVWKMGGAAYTRDGATYLQVTGDPQTAFYRQHDARFLPGGQISLFDDATEKPGPARGVVYSYDLGAGTATPVWQYPGTVSSEAMGSFRVAADGSRLIGWGEGGAPKLAFTEVDASGHDLLDFEFTDGDESYRALKVPLAQLDLGLMRTSVSALASTDGGAVDSGGAQRSPTGGTGCFALSGSGATAECTYSVAGESCPLAGGIPGGCPASGLVGCCVQTVTSDAGVTLPLAATCYYDPTMGQAAASQCAFEGYEGQPYEWQTYAP
ncbi:MAG TPA: arylsulfotransferase family protein, partial [Polyangiaceae bacterium]|nr:arylsulfotransferase family protein [Polyangiaceae bacterium]